jgi:anthranilate phosphoribosyltransferase
MSFWPGLLHRLLAREDLSVEDAGEAMRRMLAGQATPAEMAAFLIALRAKGETAEELAGLSGAVLEASPTVEAPPATLDPCGTGGDGLGTFNVSTVSAFVLAGAGVTVAKHTDGAVSSRCGSAEVLAALGAPVARSAEEAARALGEVGLAFLDAPAMHPPLAHVAAVRDELQVATTLDFLWPLTNPARPETQLVGVADAMMMESMAGALAARGTRAWVVRGTDGMDEVTTTGPTEILEVRRSIVQRFHLLPIEVGVSVARPEQLAGGDARHNAGIASAVLQGERGPARDLVVLNTAASLVVAGTTDEVPEAVPVAEESIDSGRAGQALTRLIGSAQRA